jgi:hypothetical protein
MSQQIACLRRIKEDDFLFRPPRCAVGMAYFQRAAKRSFNCGSDVAADSGPIIREDFASIASISADADSISETGLTVAILSRCLLQLGNLQNTLKLHRIRFHKWSYRNYAPAGNFASLEKFLPRQNGPIQCRSRAQTIV